MGDLFDDESRNEAGRIVVMAWAKFPTQWVLNSGLRQIQWGTYKGDGTAALIVLIALAILRNRRGLTTTGGIPPNDPTVVATYDQLQAMTGISRAKLAAALKILLGSGIVERIGVTNPSVYRLPGVDIDGGWAKLPQSHLEKSGVLTVLSHFTLRNPSEFEALKVYLLVVAFRNGRSGYAHIGYDKIVEHTGIQSNRVRRAKSFLIANDLIHAENDPEARPVQGRAPLRYKVIGL